MNFRFSSQKNLNKRKNSDFFFYYSWKEGKTKENTEDFPFFLKN